MSARRAMIRLWVVGTIAWIAYWTWNFARDCLRMDDGSLWCPAINGNALSRTDRWHMASAIFGLPLSTLACGLICLWAVRATRRHLESEIERKE